MEKFCLDCESEKKCQIGSRCRCASADVVARAQALSPGRRRRRPSVEVWGVGEKTPLPRGTHCRMGACVVGRAHTYVVAWTQALSPGRRCHRSSVEVWGVCEKTPLPRGTRRRTGADVVAWAHALSPAHMRPRTGASVSTRAYTSLPERGRFARAPTALVARRRRRAGAGVVACASPVCAGTSEGIKGPGFPSLLTFLPSEASWPGLALQQLLARTSRIGLFLLCYLFM